MSKEQKVIIRSESGVTEIKTGYNSKNKVSEEDKRLNKEYKYLYYCWAAIKQRLFNTNHPNYKTHGGRGILMQREWINDSGRFIKDILENLGPKPKGHRLTRINHDGNFEINNLKWDSGKNIRRVEKLSEEIEAELKLFGNKKGHDVIIYRKK